MLDSGIALGLKFGDKVRCFSDQSLTGTIIQVGIMAVRVRWENAALEWVHTCDLVLLGREETKVPGKEEKEFLPIANLNTRTLILELNNGSKIYLSEPKKQGLFPYMVNRLKNGDVQEIFLSDGSNHIISNKVLKGFKILDDTDVGGALKIKNLYFGRENFLGKGEERMEYGGLIISLTACKICKTMKDPDSFTMDFKYPICDDCVPMFLDAVWNVFDKTNTRQALMKVCAKES
jgi:hypothetical protein